ncbi:CPBP family intramembrane metalloprotease [Lacibacter luteus]|uniref:CPBP family intramembrane metalloprotease n=1 Tax=Lacibacter luteus TaxID=2508719 RepID=A0A4Q1CNA6_9BACT|nr:type II CAAX endopeptidase family protein [Lacibacter luteus]RXK62099.1 CPBP family intramembrane metalloprotease [Lacibacter luteus]
MDSTAAIKKSWLRVLLFVIFFTMLTYFGSTLVAVFFVVLGLPQTDTSLFYVGTVLIFLSAFLSVWIFRKAIDRKSFASLGFKWKGFTNERNTGFLTGIVAITILAAVLWAMQLLQWFTADINWIEILQITFILILVSFSEELVFRGYILNNLLQAMPKLPALLISALLFAGFHTLNPGMSLIAFLNIFVAGALMGTNYIFTRNLWFSIFFHFSWNFFQGPVLGFEVSGLDLPVMLEQNLRGSTLLTGGAFGLEASWLATFILSITGILLFVVFQRKYKSVE